MKLAYVAGPYNAPTVYGIVHNIRAAEAVGAELLVMGYATIIPHKNSALMDGVISHERILEMDLEILRRCDLLVVLPGWESSPGTQAEIREAHNEIIPVMYWPDDREQILAAVRDPDPFADYGAELDIVFEADPRLRAALAGGEPDD